MSEYDPEKAKKYYQKNKEKIKEKYKSHKCIKCGDLCYGKRCKKCVKKNYKGQLSKLYPQRKK